MSGTCDGFNSQPCAVHCCEYDEVLQEELPTCRECGHGKSWHTGASAASQTTSSVAIPNTSGSSSCVEQNKEAIEAFQRLLSPKTTYHDAQSEALSNFRTSPSKTQSTSNAAVVEQSSTPATTRQKGKGRVKVCPGLPVQVACLMLLYVLINIFKRPA